MPAVVTRNSRGDTPPVPPRKDDGTLYPIAMRFDGGGYLAYADDYSDLAAVLIGEDYPSMSEQDRLIARIRYAVNTQVVLQVIINADHDMDGVSESEREVLFGTRDRQPQIDWWTNDIPLVLVDTGYAPYSDVPPPMTQHGDTEHAPNLIWLRPAQEQGLLDSLAEAGWIELAFATGDEGDPTDQQGPRTEVYFLRDHAENLSESAAASRQR